RTTSGGRRSGSRRSSAALRQVGEPDLDERADRLLEPGLARHRERLLPALARLRGVDALLQPVVAGHEQLLDALPHKITLHKASVTRQIVDGWLRCSMSWRFACSLPTITASSPRRSRRFWPSTTVSRWSAVPATASR